MSWTEWLSEIFFLGFEKFESDNYDVSAEGSGEVDVQSVPDRLPS